MVTYRSISIEFRSQFGLQLIPEYSLPESNSNHSNLSGGSQNAQLPTVTYIPTYPRSQFWIYYDISPPHPPSTYFYFKLFINGAHIVSWGCGKEEGFRGKTQYALYENVNAERRLKNNFFRAEKRFFFFAPERDGFENRDKKTDRVIDIKVYRSQGRKRIQSAMERFDTTQAAMETLNGVELPYAGTYERHRPQKYYTYFLLDPIDKPFAEFRYLYRSWDELCQLGVASPYEHTTPTNSSPAASIKPDSGLELSVSSIHSVGKFVEDCYAWGEGPSRAEHIRTGSPLAKTKKRLSFPPSILLTPRGQHKGTISPENARADAGIPTAQVSNKENILRKDRDASNMQSSKEEDHLRGVRSPTMGLRGFIEELLPDPLVPHRKVKINHIARNG